MLTDHLWIRSKLAKCSIWGILGRVVAATLALITTGLLRRDGPDLVLQIVLDMLLNDLRMRAKLSERPRAIVLRRTVLRRAVLSRSVLRRAVMLGSD